MGLRPSVMLVSLEINMLIHFPKLEPPSLLRWSLAPLSSNCQNPLHSISRMETSHSPFYRDCPVPTVSQEELVFSRSICFELSAFASMVKTSYYCHKSVARKTFRSVCGHLRQSFNHFLLDCLASEFLCKFIFSRCCLHSGVWLKCWVSAKFLCFSFLPRKGLGSTTTQSSRFKIKNNAGCFIDC